MLAHMPLQSPRPLLPTPQQDPSQSMTQSMTQPTGDPDTSTTHTDHTTHHTDTTHHTTDPTTGELFDASDGVWRNLGKFLRF